MIRATELAGRAVIDIDAAEKVGTIDKMILNPDGRCVAGFVVVRGGSRFPGSKASVLIPSGAVHAIGPDAVTIKQSAVVGTDIGRLEAFPRGSDVIGRKVVSEDGRFLGKISDVLIDRIDGRIVGYLLSEHTPSRKPDDLPGADKHRRHAPYLPADATLRTGRDLVVASEDAVRYDDWSDENAPVHQRGTPVTRWGYANAAGPDASAQPAPSNEWIRVNEEHVHPMARTPGGDLDGIDTAKETNPRVR
jgi:uncharacterized protein YrrD